MQILSSVPQMQARFPARQIKRRKDSRSKFGKRWEFDGVPAAFVTRSAVNGHYCITFEREEASLEQIEQINWSRPAIRRLTDRQDELGLPEGYGFELTDVRYQHSGRYFVAEVRTASQYLGDVSAYQAQIAELNGKLAERQAALEAQVAQADAAVSSMEAAYEEGVESNG